MKLVLKLLLISVILFVCVLGTSGHSLAQYESTMRLYLPVVTQGKSPCHNSDSAGNLSKTAENQPRNIYALLGEVHRAEGQRFESFLVTTDGQKFALVGKTPDIEDQLLNFHDRQPAVEIKVWGTLTTDNDGDGFNELVVRTLQIVSDTLKAQDLSPNTGTPTATPTATPTRTPTATPTAIPTPTPTRTATPLPTVDNSQPQAAAKFNQLMLYREPSTGSEQVGTIFRDQTCTITGRNEQSTWWELTCSNALRGWVMTHLVTVTGNTSGVVRVQPPQLPQPTDTIVPTSVPLATLTLTPQAFQGWKTSYFNNRQLEGNPIAFADNDSIDFNWGFDRPVAESGVDNFSIRFERTIDFSSGYYRFTTNADDGVRVWLDGELMIDEWHGSTAPSYMFGRDLSGQHSLRVEYYEASGTASVSFDYAFFRSSPDWTASFFNNIDLAGQPAVVRQEPVALGSTVKQLNHDWGQGAPLSSQIGRDAWSSRWVGSFYFEGGNYIFKAESNDGVRVYLNNLLVIDQWSDGYHENENQVLAVGEDRHTVTVEYYERSDDAQLKVWWYRDGESQLLP